MTPEPDPTTAARGDHAPAMATPSATATSRHQEIWLYRNAILHTGARLHLSEAWRGEQVPQQP